MTFERLGRRGRAPGRGSVLITLVDPDGVRHDITNPFSRLGFRVGAGTCEITVHHYNQPAEHPIRPEQKPDQRIGPLRLGVTPGWTYDFDVVDAEDGRSVTLMGPRVSDPAHRQRFIARLRDWRRPPRRLG